MTEIRKTRTYIAADWDNDKDVVEVLRKWNDSNYWNLNFTDAHELHSCRDESLNCTIKRSLVERMKHSKRFVLIVGNNTASVRAGQCGYCNYYRKLSGTCIKGISIYRSESYIDFECRKAVESGISIIVLYKGTNVTKSNCPSILQKYGVHLPLYYRGIDGQLYYNYHDIKKAFDEK